MLDMWYAISSPWNVEVQELLLSKVMETKDDYPDLPSISDELWHHAIVERCRTLHSRYRKTIPRTMVDGRVETEAEAEARYLKHEAAVNKAARQRKRWHTVSYVPCATTYQPTYNSNRDTTRGWRS